MTTDRAEHQQDDLQWPDLRLLLAVLVEGAKTLKEELSALGQLFVAAFLTQTALLITMVMQVSIILFTTNSVTSQTGNADVNYSIHHGQRYFSDW